MQFLVQFVSQQLNLLCCSCMSRGVTPYKCFLQLVSQLVPLGTRLRLKTYFYWLIAQNIARQVARGVLHCAMLQKSVAALPQSLRKVELDSTSCNACCSKNVARLDHCLFVTPCNFSCNLCRSKIARQVARKIA